MSLDFLPKEIEDLIIKDKEDMEFEEYRKEHKKKMEDVLWEIKRMSITHYIISEEEFAINYWLTSRKFANTNQHTGRDKNGFFKTTDRFPLEDEQYKKMYRYYRDEEEEVNEDEYYDCISIQHHGLNKEELLIEIDATEDICC